MWKKPKVTKYPFSKKGSKMCKDNMAGVLDAMKGVGVYVIERSTHIILYFNKKMTDIAPRIHLGAVCSDTSVGDCVDCPLQYTENKEFHQSSHYIEANDSYLTTTASKIMWNDIPAYMVEVYPFRIGEEDGPSWLEQAKVIYAQSMGILLTECYIVNLTENYFLTCQMGGAGVEMSDRQSYQDLGNNYLQEVIHKDDMEEFRQTFSRDALLAYFSTGEEVRTMRVRRLTEMWEYHVAEYSARLIEQYGVEDRWCVLTSKDIQAEVLREQKTNLEMSQLAKAAKAVYQILIALNLTQNTYKILENSGSFILNIPRQGKTEDALAAHAAVIAPEFQEDFIHTFSVEAILSSFQSNKEKIYMELRQKNEEGTYFWNSMQVVQVPNHYNDDILAVSMCQSVDAQRREQEINLQKEQKAKKMMEEALQKATEGSLAKSEFLSKVSHDIRTPMNGILGMTALAQANMDDFGKLSGYLANIKLSGEHLLGLINEVLDMSKIENGSMVLEDKPFDLERLSEEVIAIVHPLIQKKEQLLVVDVSDRMHTLVSGDEQRLRQVLAIILENASKYSGRKGEIRFTVLEQPSADTKIGHYMFRIQDNGIGMQKDFLDHIYEPFAREADTRTSKVAGTGLGLTIVKNMINLMGGDIQVDSKLGEGSCFTINLYLVKKASDDREEDKAIRHQYGDFSLMRVLVAEDNDMNQEIMEEMIRLTGATPEIVSDGLEAVKVISEHPSDYYDLVLMDIRMPGMNGYEATEKIRALSIPGIQELPIIALTADVFKDDIRRAKKAGMNGHAGKPVTFQKLKAILEYCRVWGRADREFPFYIENED
jgi:signal transduction histidine kinase/AmiR/NasT family two-component response regulator